MENLSAIVRRNEVETMLGNARLTRDYPDCEERAVEARRQVYMVMYKAALGTITDAERRAILDILRPCCPELFASSARPPEHMWELPVTGKRPVE